MSEEQRRFQRILYDAKLQIEFSRRTLTAHLIDLSLHGCLIEFENGLPDELESDRTYPIHIRLNEETKISIFATLAHLRSENLAAFVFQEMELESITALRRLVELNLGDSALLERDMRSLVQTDA